MSKADDENLSEYYREAQSWAADRDQSNATSRKTAWTVAAVATAIALLEAIALVLLLPLKTTVPYTLLVDKQTGFVQALKPLEGQSLKPNEAMERSFLAQYVIAREGFDIDTLRDSYRKVALWSAGDARARYLNEVKASNPASPLATLPRKALVEVEVRSISPIDKDTALVRFASTRTDPGGQRLPSRQWVSVLTFRYTGEPMSEADRIVNPLGFQVTRYRRDAELAPVAAPSTAITTTADPAFPAPAQSPGIDGIM